MAMAEIAWCDYDVAVHLNENHTTQLRNHAPNISRRKLKYVLFALVEKSNFEKFISWLAIWCLLPCYIYFHVSVSDFGVFHTFQYPSFGLMAWSFGSIEEHIWTWWIRLLSMLLLIYIGCGWLKLLDCLF
jgi:hypothetical protein